MSINETLLAKLDSKQVIFASKILEQIFLKKEKNIQIETQEEENIICTLIAASEKASMKYNIFIHLNSQSQKNCFLKLTFSDQEQLLIQIKNTTLIVSLFNKLENVLQKEFLTHCYQKKPELFQKLKKALKPNISIKQGIIIGKSNVGTRQCIIYKEKLLHQITDPQFSKKEVTAYINSLLSTLNEKDFESLTELFFNAFKELNLPLSNKEEFASYLKFFEISVQMTVLHPQYNKLLESILDHFLISLTKINSSEWHLKILNQLPLFILKKCCENFSQYEKIKNKKIRTIYFNFFKLIENNLNNDQLETIKTAMNFS
tara:strand:- start:14 stop:964 length:951 start_codon:yes stop_codon:yes gene_type:complete